MYSYGNTMLRYTNHVCSANLHCVIDLKDLSHSKMNTVFNSKKFNGLIWRHKKISGTCLVFQTGNIICCGMKTLKGCRKTVRQYSRQLQLLGYNITLNKIKLVTRSATYKLSSYIDYNKVHF